MTVQSPSPPSRGDINHTSYRQWSGQSIYTVHITAMTRHNSLGCCDDSIYTMTQFPPTINYVLILLVFMFINVLIVAINWLI